MKIALITGVAGLVGSDAARFFHARDFSVVGIDNGMREYFFGEDGSVRGNLESLLRECPNVTNDPVDIRDAGAVRRIFSEHNRDIAVVVHNAAQPSHDWAAREPQTDFGINAVGTLNLLEATRQYCPQAVFIFSSTNKVYGDNPNRLPLVELETRWELDPGHAYYPKGIDENMSVDHCVHSVFGASKLAADIMVQEYGRYFGMKTGIFRGGCLTGSRHAGAELHGYLAYLMKCAVTGREYRIYGWKGKQVRDNLHSEDLANAFYHFYQNPRCGEVYNMGGGRVSHCSMLEAVRLCEKITGNSLRKVYVETPRAGDHIWWVSDVSKFQSHYPGWRVTKGTEEILKDIFEQNRSCWAAKV
ncbi:MAG: NAD-dependent epimerase/dehydratase family protein [Candidatus Omnitrophica bacterium]|nr:NAD-dependent epimerase/dehydratase family protein [Candidatus Omnitrophota bacterium]